MAPIPITIVTGFLGSGKTTLILRLIPQLPKDYKIALLKNEFGDLAIDTQLATAASIAGVHELLNGCICCNLVGQLHPALTALRRSIPNLDRIVIETSGSAFPATLALEVNRIAREEAAKYASGDNGEDRPDRGGDEGYVLDGVVSVIDVENWAGYEDTSYTAKMQARYTDLIVLNKWERAGEGRVEEVRDRIGDLDVGGAVVRSDHGRIDKEVLLGLDGRMVGGFEDEVGGEGGGEVVEGGEHEHEEGHGEEHQREVEVLSVALSSSVKEGQGFAGRKGVNLESLETFLLAAPKDEIYRIKALVQASSPPASSGGEVEPAVIKQGQSRAQYILNWAFGRWTFTPMISSPECLEKVSLATTSSGAQTTDEDPLLRMTVILARGETKSWKARIEAQGYIEPEDVEVDAHLKIKQIL